MSFDWSLYWSVWVGVHRHCMQISSILKTFPFRCFSRPSLSLSLESNKKAFLWVTSADVAFVAPSPSRQLFNKIVACIARTFFCMVASLNHGDDAIGLISKSNHRNVNSTSVQLWGTFRHRATSLVILDYKNCSGKGIVALISKIIVSSIAFVATSISSEIPMESVLSHFLNHNLS